jgi:hypothetical protein
MKWVLWFLGAFVVPLLVSLWHQEVYAWCPNLAKRLIFLASFLVPREHRARYRNEWLAELDTLEGKNLSQVLFALGIILSAPRTRLALIASPSRSNKWLKGLSQAIPVWPRQERRRLTALVEELADRQSELKDAIRREVVATDRLRAAEFIRIRFSWRFLTSCRDRLTIS